MLPVCCLDVWSLSLSLLSLASPKWLSYSVMFVCRPNQPKNTSFLLNNHIITPAQFEGCMAHVITVYLCLHLVYCGTQCENQGFLYLLFQCTCSQYCQNYSIFGHCSSGSVTICPTGLVCVCLWLLQTGYRGLATSSSPSAEYWS